MGEHVYVQLGQQFGWFRISRVVYYEYGLNMEVDILFRQLFG
jgi:hypothetical protein